MIAVVALRMDYIFLPSTYLIMQEHFRSVTLIGMSMIIRLRTALRFVIGVMRCGRAPRNDAPGMRFAPSGLRSLVRCDPLAHVKFSGYKNLFGNAVFRERGHVNDLRIPRCLVYPVTTDELCIAE